MREFIAAFDALRIESRAVEDAYFHRLAALCGIPPSPSIAIRHSRGGLSALAATTWRFLGLLPALLRQYARISQTAHDGAVAVAIASNRTRLDRESSVQHGLGALARAIPAGATHEVSERILKARTLWIVDALPISTLWSHSSLSTDNRPIIVDTSFLIACALMTAATHPIAMAGSVTSALRGSAARRTGVREIARMAVAAALAFTYQVLISRARLRTGIWFTSNSFTIELFRFVFLADANTTEAVEIMHGVGSAPFEAYVRRFREALPAGASKLRVVPQVPDVRLYGALRTGDQEVEAINTYANQYFIAHAGTLAGLIDRVREDLRVTLANGEPAPLRVAILGNFPTDGRLQDSPSFAAECLLIDLIASAAERQGKPVRFVYCPHPAFAAADFQNPVFIGHGVTICPRTPSAWLGADVCVSLMSSTLIETEFFGARALTPLLAEDGFFPAHYLAQLAAPRDGTLAALTETIETVLRQARPSLDLASRVSMRLARTSWGDAHHAHESIRVV